MPEVLLDESDEVYTQDFEDQEEWDVKSFKQVK
jgi:hypothetical protein